MSVRIQKWNLGVVFFLALSLPVVPAYAVNIPGIFSTGVSNSGTVLAGGSSDSHFVLTNSTGQSYGTGSGVVLSNANKLGSWSTAAGSAWISSSDSHNPVSGTYNYATTFNLTGLNLSSVNIVGQWASDDNGTIILNGHALTAFNTVWNGGMVNFNITGSAYSQYLLPGNNTLDFQVWGNGITDGVDVQMTGTANALNAPEPGDYAMICSMTLSGLGLLYRRQRIRKA